MVQTFSTQTLSIPENAIQTTMAASAVSASNSQQVQVVSVAVPPLPRGGALVRMTGCGLCGSDLDKLRNNKATAGQVLGHELVGVIKALDASINGKHGFQVGDRLVSAHHVPCQKCQYCLNDSESMCRQFKATNFYPGGFAEVVALTEGHLNHTAFKVPDAVSDAEASAVEPLACVLKAIERGGALVNGRVGVLGLGFIGLMASQVYKNRGDSVLGFDVNQLRCQLALNNHYLDDALTPNQVNEAHYKTLDLVFLSVLRPETVELALNLLRDGGRLVLFSGSKPNTVQIDPNILYFREISIIPGYSPSLKSLKEAADMIFEQKIDVATLCTHHYSLSEMNEAITIYSNGKDQSGQAIKVLITP